MEYNVGILTARRLRLQGPRTHEKLLRRGSNPPSHQLWGLGSGVCSALWGPRWSSGQF